MTPEDADDVRLLHLAHADRVARLDPVVAVSQPPTDAAAQAHWGPGRAVVGVATAEDVVPGSSSWLWSTDRAHRLALRCAVDPETDDVLPVLDEWLAVVAAGTTPGDATTSASVGLVSRDSGAVEALVRRHFTPASVLAVRRRGQGATAVDDPDGVLVREAGPDDLEPLSALALELHDHEARFGAVPSRPDGLPVLRAGMSEQLSAQDGWSWLAERDGEVVGVCTVTPPGAAEWVTSGVTVTPAAYLSELFVAPDARAGGVGAALAGRAHARLDAEGVAATVLHHGANNPLSVPFWGAQGYRPLVTTWMRAPARL